MKNLNGNYQGTCAELLLLNVVGIRVHVCLIEWAGIVRFADEGTFSSCMYECEPWEMDGKRVQKGLDREACGRRRKKETTKRRNWKGLKWSGQIGFSSVMIPPVYSSLSELKCMSCLWEGPWETNIGKEKQKRRGEARRGEGRAAGTRRLQKMNGKRLPISSKSMNGGIFLQAINCESLQGFIDQRLKTWVKG